MHRLETLSQPRLRLVGRETEMSIQSAEVPMIARVQASMGAREHVGLLPYGPQGKGALASTQGKGALASTNLSNMASTAPSINLKGWSRESSPGKGENHNYMEATDKEARGGIGIQLTQKTDGSFVIENVPPGGPAATTGKIHPGDELVSVNGIKLAGRPMSFVAPLIVGAPNTVVKLSLLRRSLTRASDAVRRRLFTVSVTRTLPPRRPPAAPHVPIVPTLALHTALARSQTSEGESSLKGGSGSSYDRHLADIASARAGSVASAKRFKSPRNHEEVDQGGEETHMAAPDPRFERPFKSPRNHEPLAHLSPPGDRDARDAHHRHGANTHQDARGNEETSPRKQIMFATEAHVIGTPSQNSENPAPPDVTVPSAPQYASRAAQHANRAQSVDPEHGAPDDWYASPAAPRSSGAHVSDRTGDVKCLVTVDYGRLARPTSSSMTRQQQQQHQEKAWQVAARSCSDTKASPAAHRWHSSSSSSYTGGPTRPVNNPRIHQLSTPKSFRQAEYIAEQAEQAEQVRALKAAKAKGATKGHTSRKSRRSQGHVISSEPQRELDHAGSVLQPRATTTHASTAKVGVLFANSPSSLPSYVSPILNSPAGHVTSSFKSTWPNRDGRSAVMSGGRRAASPPEENATKHVTMTKNERAVTTRSSGISASYDAQDCRVDSDDAREGRAGPGSDFEAPSWWRGGSGHGTSHCTSAVTGASGREETAQGLAHLQQQRQQWAALAGSARRPAPPTDPGDIYQV